MGPTGDSVSRENSLEVAAGSGTVPLCSLLALVQGFDVVTQHRLCEGSICNTMPAREDETATVGQAGSTQMLRRDAGSYKAAGPGRRSEYLSMSYVHHTAEFRHTVHNTAVFRHTVHDTAVFRHTMHDTAVFIHPVLYKASVQTNLT